MPRSKSRSKSRSKKRLKPSGERAISWGGAYSDKKRRRDYAIAGAVLLAVTAGVAFTWWRSVAAEREFLAFAAEGEATPSRAQTVPSLGGGHLQPGQSHFYPDQIPTSGPHDRVWTKPGVYDRPQRPTQIVHALEHGNIVIYYDQAGAEVLQTLGAWADVYDGRWDGIVVTPMAGLGQSVVLTAWARRLDLDRFDPAPAAAFIDGYRGRGPENPVR